METEEMLIGKGSLAYRRTSGRGHPVVFLHGMMDSSWSWDEYALALSRPTIAFDLPGFGESTPRGTDSLPDWARTIIRGLDRLEIERFYLVGHSLGGALASKIADLAPERVISLTLISSAGYSNLPLAHILSRPEVELILGQTAPHAIRLKPLVRLAYRSLFSHKQGIDRELLERVIRDRRRTVPGIKEGMHILDKLHQNHFQSNHYQGPVSVIWGDHDHLTPKEAIPSIQTIWPEAKVYLLPDAGHHPQHEEKEEVEKILLEATSSKEVEKDSMSEEKVSL